MTISKVLFCIGGGLLALVILLSTVLPQQILLIAIGLMLAALGIEKFFNK